MINYNILTFSYQKAETETTLDLLQKANAYFCNIFNSFSNFTFIETRVETDDTTGYVTSLYKVNGSENYLFTILSTVKLSGLTSNTYLGFMKSDEVDTHTMIGGTQYQLSFTHNQNSSGVCTMSETNFYTMTKNDELIMITLNNSYCYGFIFDYDYYNDKMAVVYYSANYYSILVDDYLNGYITASFLNFTVTKENTCITQEILYCNNDKIGKIKNTKRIIVTGNTTQSMTECYIDGAKMTRAGVFLLDC